MNQKGEVTTFFILILVALTGLFILLPLELEHSFRFLKKRSHLFLCTKETKGELSVFLIQMGQLNWVLKNLSKAQAVAVFIPPLWPYIGNIEELKKVIKALQLGSLTLYLSNLSSLKSRECPLDPQLLLTPYELGGSSGFKRSSSGAAKLRKKKWSYHFLSYPYLLVLDMDIKKATAVEPKIHYEVTEKGEILSSLSL